MNEFFTWSFIASFAGCITCTAIVTQFIKNVGFLKQIPTQWVSYILANVLLLGASYFTGAVSMQQLSIIPVNAILIALSSNGAYAALDRANKSNISKNADGDIPAGAASNIELTEIIEDKPDTVPKV